MAPKHGIRANRKPAEPKATIQAAPSWYDKTHPVGSAERFLDTAAKEALVAAAAGGLITPGQAVVGATKAVADELQKHPDPLLAEAAKLPKDELLRRAARAEALQNALKTRNHTVETLTTIASPTGNMAVNQLGTAAKEALDTRLAAKGGEAEGAATAEEPPPEPLAPASPEGPRIVINPTTFHNQKDALCVAFNEGFRLWMEATEFEPQSEPTDAQRKFFSDTAYADDEVQLRRTILARIATFDTSVKDPTDDQLAETGAFLDAILESDWCKNDWERNCVSKLSQAVKASVGAQPAEPKAEPLAARPEEPLQAKAALGGGETEEDETTPPPAVPETVAEPTAEPEETPPPQETPPGENGSEGTPPGENAPEGAQEPPGAQGEEKPGDEPSQPQNAPEGRETPVQPLPPGQRNGLTSGVWTGGEEGKGRQLTAREAEWMRNRIESGATVTGQQLAMFGLSRNEKGELVDQNGDPFKSFGDTAVASSSPDAKLDAGGSEPPLRKKKPTSTTRV